MGWQQRTKRRVTGHKLAIANNMQTQLNRLGGMPSFYKKYLVEI